MAMYYQKFGGRQRGLQVSQANKTQSGLLVAENVDLEREGVIRKRPGSTSISLSNGPDPEDVIPADEPQALYSRGAELLLETPSELFARQRCGLAGGGAAGTATPGEIAAAIDAVETRRDQSRVIDVPLPGDVLADNVRDRLARPDISDDVIIMPSGRTITFSATSTSYTVSEVGEESIVTPLSGLNQRLIRMTAFDPVPPPSDKPLPIGIPLLHPVEPTVVAVTWLSEVSPTSAAAVLTLQLVYVFQVPIPELQNNFQIFIETTELGAIRGPKGISRYEVKGTISSGRIAAFRFNSPDLRIVEFSDPSMSDDYAVTDLPVASAGYAIDVESSLTTETGVTWSSFSDGVQHLARLDRPGPAIGDQASRIGMAPSTSIQIALLERSVIFYLLADKFTNAADPRPVWQYEPAPSPPTLKIKMVDLDGDDLRMSFSRVSSGDDVGRQQYTMKNAGSGLSLYPPITVQGITGETDAQWLPQNDTIFGALTSPPDGLHEVLWQRSAEVQSSGIDPTITSAALAVFDDPSPLPATTDRIVLSYWLSDTNLRVIRRNNIDSSALTQVISVPEGVGVFDGVIGSAILQHSLGNTVWMMIWTWLPSGDVFTVATTSAAAPADVNFVRTDSFPDIPAFASGFATIPSTVRGLLSVSYASESIEVYEVTDTLFVRVSPAFEIRAGGDWASRGPWSRTRLRSQIVRYHAGNDVVSADASTVLNDEGIPCTFVATEVTNNGAVFDILTEHNEAQGVIDATGARPRVSPYTSTELFVGVEGAALGLSFAIWSPGSPLSFTPSGVTLRAERAWDQTGFEVDAEPAGVWATVNTKSSVVIEILVWPRDSAPFSFARLVNSAVTVDVSISARVLPDGETVELTWAACGISIAREVWVGIESVNMTSQVVTPIFSNNHQFPTVDTPRACSAASLDGITVQAWTERDGPINRHVEVADITALSSSTVASYKRSALVSQLVPVGGTLAGVLSLLGTSATDPDVDAATFVGGKTKRNGLVLVAPSTGQVIGRVGIGEVEDFAERLLRVPKTGLNITESGELVLGWQETDLDTGTAKAPLSSLYQWTTNVGAHSPAVLDGVLVSPHGGFPIMYDGQQLHEHDWHELPEIVAVAVVAAGTNLTAGVYSLAVTWRSIDATGKLYRSRPTFAGPFTLSAGDAINVSTRDLTQTTRTDVRGVLWRTTVGGTVFFRETEILAILPAAQDATLNSLSLEDSELSGRERLDQGDLEGDILPSDPTAITDWSAVANGRIWSRNPRTGGRVNHTVTRREGFGLHWNGTGFVDHNGSGVVNGMAEMNGRAAMLSDLDGSAFYGDGPTETGAGAYSVPAHLTLKIGTNEQATLAIIPEGLAYGASRGVPPQLLTGGWNNAPIGEAVSALFHRDGQTVVASAYVQATDTLHMLDDGQEGGVTKSLRFHFGSRTWADDTFRQGRDLTVLESGELAILTVDGRVLLEDLEVYDSGGVGYVTRFRTGWLTASPNNPGSAGTFVAVHIVGTYEGVHSLRLLIRYDYREVVAETATIDVATLAAHAAEGQEYAYAYNTHGEGTRRAISVEVQDTGEPNETWSIEAVLVQSRVEDAALTQLQDGHQFSQEAP